MKTFFAWLGSGRTRKWDVGDKVKRLDQAAKAGLPVPLGAALLDEFLQLVVENGIVVADDGRYTAPDPQWLAETLFDSIHFPRMDTAVAVYSAHPAENSHQPAPSAVDFNDPAQLSRSLCEAWSAAPTTNKRRDLLIMVLGNTQTAGSALTSDSTEVDEVQVKDEAPLLYLPQLRAWRRPDPTLPAYKQRLQQLLRGVRRTFGKGGWEIDWMDDGRICWLRQIKTCEVSVKS